MAVIHLAGTISYSLELVGLLIQELNLPIVILLQLTIDEKKEVLNNFRDFFIDTVVEEINLSIIALPHSISFKGKQHQMKIMKRTYR